MDGIRAEAQRLAQALGANFRTLLFDHGSLAKPTAIRNRDGGWKIIPR
jgi:hypothetical protein